jgi:L-ascorbate metabolism protein UlaG (beta-lactamase superfamily)
MAYIISIVIILLLSVTIYIYTCQQKFGRKASGDRLKRISNSPNFKSGKFQNLSYTPYLTEGYSLREVLWEFFFRKNPRRKPLNEIPSDKTDLLKLHSDEDVLVWFGHSGYFIQLDGKKFVIDPVFSGNASPIPGSNRSFKGTDIYTVDDLPFTDYLFITHDHYDHADYETLLLLKPKVRKVVCGLGVGAHLEYWGFASENIIEKDWNETIDLEKGFKVFTLPARHFSGRSFSRNNTLWLSLLLQTPSLKIYIGGDSGYDAHFAAIGEMLGPVDVAILDNGQYDIKWKYIHMFPEEVIMAARDLKAKKLFPVHSSKFVMSNHSWDDPLVRISALAKSSGIPLITPKIGESVLLKQDQVFSEWWKEIK